MTNEVLDGNGAHSPAPSPGEPDLDCSPLSQDTVFAALSSKRSRYVLLALRTHEEPVEIDDLIDIVAAWETDKPISLVSDEHRERVLTSLRHAQLPKLLEMGLISHDESASVVTRGPCAEQVDAYLNIAVERDENVEL